MLVILNLLERLSKVGSYRWGVNPGESIPDMSFAAPLQKSLWLFFFALGLLHAGGTH